MINCVGEPLDRHLKTLVINSCYTVTMYLRVQGIASSLPSDDLKYPGLHGHTADATSVVLLNMGHGWHLSVLLSVFLKV